MADKIKITTDADKVIMNDGVTVEDKMNNKLDVITINLESYIFNITNIESTGIYKLVSAIDNVLALEAPEGPVGNTTLKKFGFTQTVMYIAATVRNTSLEKTISIIILNMIGSTINNKYMIINKLSEEIYTTTNIDIPAINSVLTKINTTEYTPTLDYHPSTKKYVDDSIITLEESVNNKIFESDQFTTINLESNIFYITDITDTGLYKVVSGNTSIYISIKLPNGSIDDISYTTTSVITKTLYIAAKVRTSTTATIIEANVLNPGVSDISCGLMLSTTLSNNTYESNYYNVSTTNNVLTKTNINEYTPTGDYNPSTKKYVDDTKADIENKLIDISLPPARVLYGKTITYTQADLISNSGIFKQSGFITSALHYYSKIGAYGIKSITMTGDPLSSASTYYVLIGNIVHTDPKTVLIGYNGGTYVFDTPSNEDQYLYINWYTDENGKVYAKEITIEYFTHEEINSYLNSRLIKYNHIIRNPFSFSGKVSYFTGDSITKGYNGSEIIQDSYPKLFSDVYSMTYTNLAVNGALFVEGINEVRTIPAQVQLADKNCDFLFIAGGVNDWQNGVALDTFTTTISSLCDYINENFENTKVIWITPINHIGWTPMATPVAELQEYRNIITRTVIQKDDNNRFSIIQGNLFPFPTQYDDETYKAYMFGDKLHPSTRGYQVYCASLQTLLYN